MPEPLDPNAWRRTVRGRLLFVAGAFTLWSAAIEGRLLYLQVYDHQHLVEEARNQQQNIIEIPARRGDIVDRHGRMLAYSVDADSVYAVPPQVKSPAQTVDKLCKALDGCAPDERRTIETRLSSKRSFVYVRRRVTTEQARRVAELGLPGISLIKEPRRFYPNRELAAHVLGYVGDEQKGLAGLELTYEKEYLRGEDSKVIVEKVSTKRELTRIGDPPTPGKTLELTIDENLQYIAERELRAGIEANRAAAGSVVMMDPNTGEILAMANEPTFNPNDIGRVPDDLRRNRAVQDIYEPGSTFKMITATAGLEEGVVWPEKWIDTGNGSLKMGSRVVRDTHAHGTIPFREVIALSSNIGSIKVGWELGVDRLYKYVKQFGFGTRLSPDFKGSENAGIVYRPEEWTHDGALASVAMGYQISVTPLQMAAAASAIANGGELVQPRILRAIIDGNRRQVIPRKVVRRVASPKTFATLVPILEEVVESGTAKATQIEGFTVAGKTGTSAKLVDRHYSKSEYNASFIGFAPSRNPAVTIVVWIDTPRAGSTYGGVVAGPVFQRIASQALRYLAVPRNVNPETPILVRHETGSELRVAGPARPMTILTPAPLQNGELVLPELRGLGGREALRVLARLGLSARVSGDGVVLEQEPPAGTAVEAGAACRLALGRVLPREAVSGGLHP